MIDTSFERFLVLYFSKKGYLFLLNQIHKNTVPSFFSFFLGIAANLVF